MIKKHFLLWTLAMLIASQSLCQVVKTSCNRATRIKKQQKDLIKEVCVPKGYIINHIYTRLTDVDVNGDSLPDFVFDWHKQKLKDGDTIRLTFYRMNRDSSYSLLRTFDNVLPIYISDYNSAPKKRIINKIYSCYNQTPPLVDLRFENGTLVLKIRIDPASGYFLVYGYDVNRNDWFLNKFQEWIDMPDGTTKFENREISQEIESINEFSYQKYLCPELSN